MMADDARIGVTGGVEPDVCASSGEKVQGRHANTYSLPNGMYYRVLGKHAPRWTDADHARMVALVTTPTITLKPKTDDLKGDKS